PARRAATRNDTALSTPDQKKKLAAAVSDRPKRSNSQRARSDWTKKPPPKASMLKSAARVNTRRREGPSGCFTAVAPLASGWGRGGAAVARGWVERAEEADDDGGREPLEGGEADPRRQHEERGAQQEPPRLEPVRREPDPQGQPRRAQQRRRRQDSDREGVK